MKSKEENHKLNWNFGMILKETKSVYLVVVFDPQDKLRVVPIYNSQIVGDTLNTEAVNRRYKFDTSGIQNLKVK